MALSRNKNGECKQEAVSTLNMKKPIMLKLQHHQKSDSKPKDEDLIVNLKDLAPYINEGDVVEIYHQEDELPRLLLQIPHYKEDVAIQKDISIDQNISMKFQLKPLKDVIVEKVDPKDVSLELVELTFKEQYLGRSDMWRLKKSLINSAVYTGKRIDFCSGSIRCNVLEMWSSSGEKVASGVVTADTKISFRSSTSMIYLFIQMSSEMWEFDNNGNLYFEKAVNGFLHELFTKWKENGCCHEVSIVLFTRVFESNSHHGTFDNSTGKSYEDFYRVVVYNKRCEDWNPMISVLHNMFHNYKDDILRIYPNGIFSSACEGNFLEVVNISLNVFEKHYMDRSFDRTGQVAIVITPGSGVFEVSEELKQITELRVIDNGVSVDLVCVGEQPPHAIPVLFCCRDDQGKKYQYDSPHEWINLSFFISNKNLGYNSFVPSLKEPLKHSSKTERKLYFASSDVRNCSEEFEKYDCGVFKLMDNNFVLNRDSSSLKTESGPVRHMKVFDVSFSTNQLGAPKLSGTPAINIPSLKPERFFFSPGRYNEGLPHYHYVNSNEDMPVGYFKVGSFSSHSSSEFNQSGMSRRHHSPNSLFNPFNLTLMQHNRFKWIHAFPSGGLPVCHGKYKSQIFKKSSESNIEQETPEEILTAKSHEKDHLFGVDWKSLVLPVCLPVTADCDFPSDDKINSEYKVHDYTLTSEDWDIHEVFMELVSQRLSQGYQLIKKPSSVRSTLNYSSLSSSSETEKTQEYFLCYNSYIFHIISLESEILSVKHYLHKKLPEELRHGYKYNFMSPEIDSYKKSSVEFRNECLITYRWNELDHYVCHKGELPEYSLKEEWKYWRFQLVLVSDVFRHATMNIAESSFGDHCDLYKTPALNECQVINENFIKFMEMIHRTRRQPTSWKNKGMTAMRERLGSNRITEKPRIRLASKGERHRNESAGVDSTEDVRCVGEIAEEIKDEREQKHLAVSSPPSEIIESMCSTADGLPFLKQHSNLPTYTFLSFDAVSWFLEKVEGVTDEMQAVNELQKLVDKRLICHASKTTRQFVNGFILYYISTSDENENAGSDVRSFLYDWHEVEVDSYCNKIPLDVFQDAFPISVSFQKDKCLYERQRNGYLEIDINCKSDRSEWGNLLCHSRFSAFMAYEVVIQWMCGTGAIVTELATTWQRKAQSFGLHLFPVPSSPFTLPSTVNPNPLFGSLHIPLNVKCLLETDLDIFHVQTKLKLFEECILARFGFLPYVTEIHKPERNLFVHVTGNMFIMIVPADDIILNKTDCAEKSSFATSLLNMNFAKMGFLWSFNYMLTKRWKSTLHGGDTLAEKIHLDFRNFCSNHSNRLRIFLGFIYRFC